MSDSKPWFLVMTPGDANQPGSNWKREGAASRGKISARPIAPEGWVALAIFITAWTAGPLLIWLWGYLGGSFSLLSAIFWTVVFELAAIGAFVMLVLSRSTRLPPA